MLINIARIQSAVFLPITRAGAVGSTVGSSAAELESAPSPIRIPGRIEVPTNAPSELTSVILVAVSISTMSEGEP